MIKNKHIKVRAIHMVLVFCVLLIEANSNFLLANQNGFKQDNIISELNILLKDNLDSMINLFKTKIELGDTVYLSSVKNAQDKPTNELVRNLILYAQAVCLLDDNNLNHCSDKLNEVLPYFVNSNSPEILVRIYQTKGELETNLGNYLKAQEYFLISLRYLDENNETIRGALIRNRLGLNYLNLKNYDLAKENFDNAINIAQKIQNKELQYRFKINLVSVNLFQKNTPSAINILNGLLGSDYCSLKDSATFYFNLGTSYLIEKNYPFAKEYYDKCYALRTRLRDHKGIARVHNNLSKIYLSEGNYDLAYQHLNRCYRLAENINDAQLLYGSSYNLLDYFILTSKKDSAKKYLKIYTNLRDSIKNINIQTELVKLDRKYKTLEKDTQITQLQQEDALNHARLKTKNILIAVIAGFLLILLVVGYLIERQRKELAQSRRRLMRQKEDITGMNEQLRVSNLAKDRILSVIGHDLRGPVGGLKELIELYMELPEHDPQDIQNLLKAAREASTSTYHLLENLLSWANSQRGDIVFNPVATPLLPLVRQTVQLLDSSINPRQVTFEYDIPEALVVHVDMNMLRTIIRNLVSNALKYSPEQGVIRIIALEENSSLKFCVCDQGMGMSAEETQDIFKKKETYFIGSEMTAKGTGLGLILCKEFVERHGGSIWIDSEEGNGTQVWFSIPQKSVKGAVLTQLQSTSVQ